MKITVSVSRKIGQPNYGSEGASCEITVDVAEKTVGADPAALVDECRRGYSLAEQVVSEQLHRHQVEQQPAAATVAPPPAAAEPPAHRNGHSNGKHLSESHPWADPSSKPHNGRPRSGRELYPWAKRLEESGQCPKLVRRLAGYGKGEEFPDRMTEWSREQVDEAIAEVVSKQYDEATAN
jgi:hypothetical protein